MHISSSSSNNVVVLITISPSSPECRQVATTVELIRFRFDVKIRSRNLFLDLCLAKNNTFNSHVIANWGFDESILHYYWKLQHELNSITKSEETKKFTNNTEDIYEHLLKLFTSSFASFNSISPIFFIKTTESIVLSLFLMLFLFLEAWKLFNFTPIHKVLLNRVSLATD